MITAIAGLLICQLLGEILVRALALPLPGPVAGMGLMFAYLVIHGRGKTGEDRVLHDVGAVADALLRNLSLLFIPAAVGVVQYLGLLRRYGLTIALTIAISTVAALVVTVFVFRLIAQWQTHRRRQETAQNPEGETP